MTRKRVLLLAGLALVVASLALISIRKTSVEVVQVAPAPLTHSLLSSGKVVTRNRVALSLPSTARATRILVDEGDSVQPGQVLAEFDTSESDANISQARAQLSQAQARLARLDTTGRSLALENLKQADALLAQSLRQQRTTRELRERNLASQEALDSANENVSLRTSQRDAARLALEALQPEGNDYRQAMADLKSAQAGLQAALARKEHLLIRSPSPGRVIVRNIEAGGMAQPGQVIMQIAPIGKREIVLQIDEKNLAWIRQGQKATILADAFPKTPFTAKIDSIAPGINADSGTVEVKLLPDSWPDFLREDMTVSTEIVFTEKPSSLAIPIDSIQGSSSPFVWVVESGRLKHVSVTLGARDDNNAEVLTGLKKGDAVVIKPPAGLRDGQQVRATVGAPK